MVHPLLFAYLRVARAHEHFEDMRILLAKFLGDYEQNALRDVYLEPRTMERRYDPPPFWTPELASIYAGEAVQNLRTALDYLVYELARMDSGSFQDGTQFPIDTSSEVFHTHSTPLTKKGKPNPANLLPGLSQTHIDAIEELQPYKGVRWTHRLRELSNPDKHRHIFHNLAAGPIDFRVWIGPSGIFADREGGRIFEAHGPQGQDVYMEVHSSLQIFLDDGSLIVPLVSVLEDLLVQVPAVLQTFESEFQ